MATHIDAVWIGPSGYKLTDGTYLEHGHTVVSVPAFEAVDSDNWQPVDPPKPGGKTTTSEDDS